MNAEDIKHFKIGLFTIKRGTARVYVRNEHLNLVLSVRDAVGAGATRLNLSDSDREVVKLEKRYFDAGWFFPAPFLLPLSSYVYNYTGCFTN